MDMATWILVKLEMCLLSGDKETQKAYTDIEEVRIGSLLVKL